MDPAYVWSMFFCSIQGWQYHPGNKNPRSIADCAKLADLMFREYADRNGVLWPG